MLFPVIDIGSNTVKLSIIESKKIGKEPPVFFKAIVLGLKLHTNGFRLEKEAENALMSLLAEYIRISREHTKNPPLAFATASLRGLENSGEIVKRAHAELKLPIRILTGNEEALCSFLGVNASENADEGFVCDLGGGSTEIISFKNKRLLNCVSLDFGALTLMKNYPNTCEMRAAIRSSLKKSAPRDNFNNLYNSGGSAKALLKINHDILNKKGNHIKKSDLPEILNFYFTASESDTQKMKSILSNRYYQVPAFVSVFYEICDFYNLKGFTVSFSGVREGYLIAYQNSLL